MSDLRVTVKRAKTGDYAASTPTAPAKPRARPTTILDYLASLSSHTLTQLYRDPFTVLTIFRSLPPLAKHYALRLVCLSPPSTSPSPSPSSSSHPLPVDKALVDGWCRADLLSQQAHHLALTRLLDLHILLRSPTPRAPPPPPPPTYRLNPTFSAQLQLALTNQLPSLLDTPSLTSPPPSSSSSSPLTPEQLSSYATGRWDQLLHFIVGVKTGGTPPPSTQAHLLAMGLMRPAEGGKGSAITPAGFSFLFKDQHTQVWDLVLAYVGGVGSAQEREEVLTFLFHLAFMTVGADYPRAKLTPAQRRMVDDLAGFGLLHAGPATFTPTHLVLTLSSSTSAPSAGLPSTAPPSSSSSSPSSTSLPGASSSTPSPPSGYLIVETTFKVYAYSPTPFQLSLLALFTRFDYHLPNLLVASLTKDSVRRALLSHITSTEIIRYLEQYAHACMRVGGGGVLPENVVDAMRLWEAERSRMEVSEEEVCLLSEFEGEGEYRGVLEELRKGEHVVYYNDSKRTIVTTEQGIVAVKAYRQAQAVK